MYSAKTCSWATWPRARSGIVPAGTPQRTDPPSESSPRSRKDPGSEDHDAQRQQNQQFRNTRVAHDLLPPGGSVLHGCPAEFLCVKNSPEG
jgi:hypothetical protein